ncbi:MAG: VWA domain-containing protein [Acidimicrobiales bacterium]
MNDPAARWRLMLGRYSDRHLPEPTGRDQDRDKTLAYLYDRLYRDRGLRPDADDEGGVGAGPAGPGARPEGSDLEVVDWLDGVRDLFPEEVAEELTTEAVERFGLTEILTDPDALARVEPDIDTLRLLLGLRAAARSDVADAVRRLVTQVVGELADRLRSELAPLLTGRVDPQLRTRRPTGSVDARRTVERNLGTWDPERQRLLIEEVTFFRRSRLRYPWEIVLCIDQSGSMAGSVIHTAVLAGILAALPGVTVKLVVFDTRVVDLSNLVDDPVEILMSVRLGGGTDIGGALRYSEQLVTNPTRTIVALITDFREGGSVAELVGAVTRLAGAGVTLMGLAALEDGAGPAYDRTTAERVVAAGMPVAALTPRAFAQWAAGVMQ